MTHPSDPDDPDEPLTPQQERELAALLADALGPAPVTPPPHVVARLDEVLAELVAEREAEREREPATQRDQPRDTAVTPVGAAAAREAPRGNGTVVSLQARRRRLPRVLLAAAAVVVGGYAVGNLASNGSLGGGDSGGSTQSAAEGADDSADDSAGGRSASKGDGPQVDSDHVARLNGPPGHPTVRRDHLAADVRRVVRNVERTAVPGPEPDGRSGPDETTRCRVRGTGEPQRLYPVRYQGAPARLAVGPPRGGEADVTVYSCRTGDVELTGTVPAP